MWGRSVSNGLLAGPDGAVRAFVPMRHNFLDGNSDAAASFAYALIIFVSVCILLRLAVLPHF